MARRLSEEGEKMLEGVPGRLRAARGAMSLQELAYRIGTTEKTAGAWERGKQTIPLWAVIAYAQVTGVSVTEIVCDEEPSRVEMLASIKAAVAGLIGERDERDDRLTRLEAQLAKLFGSESSQDVVDAPQVNG